MIKCLCNDVSKNSQCIPNSPVQLHSFSPKQNLSGKLKLKHHVNVNLIDEKTDVSNTFGFCHTNSLCRAKLVFKNDTLDIDYSCDQNTTRTTRATNNCDDKTNIYYSVDKRGEKKISPRLPQYCCSSGDNCNSKFSSNLNNFNPLELLANKNELHEINGSGGGDKNIYLYLLTPIVTILLALIVAIFSITYMVVKKRQRSVHLRDAKSENLKQQNEKLILNYFYKVIKFSLINKLGLNLKLLKYFTCHHMFSSELQV